MDVRTSFFALLVAALGAITALMLFPLFQYIVAAGLIAFLCYPIHERLVPRAGAMGSALVLTVVAGVATIVPVLFFSLVAFRTAVQFADGFDIEETIARVDEFLADYVDVEELLGASLEDLTGDAVRQLVSPFADRLVQEATSVVATSLRVGLGLLVLVFLLYYFLKDGDRLFRWLRTVTPLEQSVITEFFEETREITWSVLKSHVLVAVIEGAAAGVGLWLLGVPNALFWTGVMIILSILPLIGVWFVWAPAVVYLAITSGPVPAIVLLVYGLSVLAFIDEYLRAYLVNRGSGLHPAVVLVGVIGGISLLGVLGIFLGPIILAVFKASVNVFTREYNPTGGPAPLGAANDDVGDAESGPDDPEAAE